MAFANNINRDMTAADARATAGQDSWSDIYPDDFDFGADEWDFLGDHRLYFDTHGEPHFVAGKNPFSSDVAKSLVAGEKDGLLSRKVAGGLEGAIRDTRSRYGEPKEWDHVIVGLTRAEAEALGTDGVKDWARAVIKAMQDSPAGDGKRQMLVTPIHTDTDNVHVQFLLHRIPVNEANRTVGASYELSRNSEAAGQMKQLNTALEAAGLPMISDFRMGAFSVSEPRAVSTEELAKAAERVVEAGGIVPPDLTTGPLSVQRERVTPEMRHLDSMLSDAIKRQKEAESVATSAATAVAAAQHARAALEQYEGEVKARAAVEAELEATRGVLEDTSGRLSETTTGLETARVEIESLTDQLTGAMARIADQADKIDTLDSEKAELETGKTELQGELEETRQLLAHADRALELEQAGRAADAKAASERESALQAEGEANAKAAAEREAVLQAENTQLLKELESARTATQQATGELEQERSTFLDRARAWAEENVRGPLMGQVDALKEELAEARRSFAKEMAEAQRNFMAQIRELTAAIRPPAAEPQSQSRRRQQWPIWARKAFGELSGTDRTAAQKSLESEIAAGRQQVGLKLEDFHRIVHERWQGSQVNTDNPSGDPKPKV